MNTTEVLRSVSNKDHYSSDACVIWCFDARFSKLLDEFINSQNLKNIDLIKIAGGAQDVAEKNLYVLDQIAKSIKLHAPKKIVLMMHTECGACGGTTDQSFYELQLAKAARVIAEEFPTLPVQLLFADFESLTEKK